MRTKHRGRGFTLVEMLMVVTVIGVLIVLLVAAVGGAARGARQTRVETEVVELERALRAYQQLYGRFPRHAQLGSDGADPETQASGGLMVNRDMARMLRAEGASAGPTNPSRVFNESVNPRFVIFMEIGDESLGNTRRGDTDVNHFVDAWGYSYRYMCDFNYDNRVEIRGFGGVTTNLVGRSVAVWSTGPTGPSNRNDFITSWE